MAEYGKSISNFGKLGSVNQVNWDDTKVFLAITRLGTLSATSKMLGIGIATVSRRLERFEEALGMRLFARDQQGYKLTDEGLALVPLAESLEQAGYALDEVGQSGEQDVSGHVRIATAQGLADHLVIPALTGFMQQNPNLTIEVVTGVATVNLHRRDADIALRMVRPDRGNVTIRRLGKLGFGLYASASYLQSSPGTELENESFVGWAETHQHLPSAQWIESILRGRPCRLMTSNLSAQVSAVCAGMGLGILPHFIAQEAGLQCVRSDIGCDQPIWLATHSDLSHSRRVKVVAEFLTQLVEVNTLRLSGAESNFNFVK
ncbi:LysR family transcriptional regulator [Vibrio ponticus]|uniref:LysR family transcriptional regulator n=1 Tax=Vibrio ponticus TaxID=265668 RepID=A0A3N3DXK0_9VIBR|nr:LysR family transcriptional regulator [Vibrio ponticus]ROV59099.1 LysR family transcriptional regulator [Vibrio ponticus]